MNSAYRVCFVCTGNICRSPMADADHRTVAVLETHGYECAHSARRFRAAWFPLLDLVIPLDRGHLRELRRLAPTPADAAKVRLLRAYARPSPGHHPSTSASHPPSGSAAADLDVPDPYYGGREDFEECLDMVETASEGLLDAVRTAVEERAA